MDQEEVQVLNFGKLNNANMERQADLRIYFLKKSDGPLSLAAK
jgi:hypothetical protein